MFLLEIFSYDFMINALIAGFLTAISTGLLGNFVVASRQAIISDMLAHTALVGVGIGIFAGISPSFLGFVSTIIFAVILWWLSRKRNQPPEAISMVLLTGGLALALLFTHLNRNNPISFETYLFGSILTISKQELLIFSVLNIFIIGVLTTFWKTFMTLVFDKDFLETRKKTVFWELLLIIIIGLIVGIGLKVIGGLLIGGLLVIPVLFAQVFSRNFFQNTLISVITNVICMITGIIGSFYLDIPTSSSIILCLIICFLVGKIYKEFHS